MANYCKERKEENIYILFVLYCYLGVPSVSFFYNDGCSFANGNFNQTISYESGCSREADTEYYYEESVMYSSSWQCSSAPNYQSLVPYFNHNYAINMYVYH